MIKLHLEDATFFDETTNEFTNVTGGVYTFEHSLKAIAEWESRWRKPFLINEKKTTEQLLDYYIDMAVGQKPNPYLFTPAVINELNKYISESPTATKIVSSESSSQNHSYVTSESLYAMMAMGGVPFECDTWNINRLVILLQVISERSKPQKKMSTQEILAQNRRLNQERRRKMKTKG